MPYTRIHKLISDSRAKFCGVDLTGSWGDNRKPEFLKGLTQTAVWKVGEDDILTPFWPATGEHTLVILLSSILTAYIDIKLNVGVLASDSTPEVLVFPPQQATQGIKMAVRVTDGTPSHNFLTHRYTLQSLIFEEA